MRASIELSNNVISILSPFFTEFRDFQIKPLQ